MEAAEESQLTAKVRAANSGRWARGETMHAWAALAAGTVLRLWMLGKLFEVTGDSLVYGDLAKNLVLHGRFALTLPSGAIYSTLIRLPGYPLFLAACFKIFGMENYFAAACVQVALDLTTCLLLAEFARRISPVERRRGAAMATLWLASLCPLTASYAAFPLTETPTLFALALGMWAMARFRERPRWPSALCFTLAATMTAMLRPDGALAGLVFAPAMAMGLRPGSGVGTIPRGKSARMAAVCVLLALAPFAVWTARNWRVFHVFQPLAPRSASDPGDSPELGWDRWVRTWSLDFVSTYEVCWNVPWDKLDVSKLPSRAFDSPAQFAETAALAADYNSGGMEITPAIDARFERLAEERIEAHPMRYYVWLPVGRLADMWLRPRVENLPIDLDWWVYAHHHAETRFSWAYAGLNAAYLLLGLAGMLRRPKFWGGMVAYMVLRSVLLLTVEAPEARYTLECFPMLIAAGGVAAARFEPGRYLSKLKAVLGRG